MSTEGKAAAGGFAALISSMIVCCSLPLLLGAGITLGAAGLALGSGLAVAAGAVLTFLGLAPLPGGTQLPRRPAGNQAA